MTETRTWLPFSIEQLGIISAALSQLTIVQAREMREIIDGRIADMQNIAQTDLWAAYREGARSLDIALTDDVEIDDDAIVSEGGDPGAWVQAWVWVSDKRAGLETNEEDFDG